MSELKIDQDWIDEHKWETSEGYIVVDADEIEAVIGSSLRPEVEKFGIAMNKRLSQNTHKDEVGWSALSDDHIIQKLKRHVREIEDNTEGTIGFYEQNNIMMAAVDLSNYAMMLLNNNMPKL